MFVNLVVEMGGRNIVHRYAIFFVLNSVTIPPQHTENFSRPFEKMQRQEHRPFAGTMFSESKTLVEDERRSGRPSATRKADNTEWVREVVRSDRRLTDKMITDGMNMNRESVRLILTEELGMRKIYAKRVPRNLTQQQRGARLSAVFYIQMHYGDAAASLLTLSRTLRLLFISKSKIGSERTPFCANIGHLGVCNAGLKKDIPQTSFQEYYKQWQHRWKRCLQAQGMYFEGDHIEADE
jgi:hypothetical protein